MQHGIFLSESSLKLDWDAILLNVRAGQNIPFCQILSSEQALPQRRY